MSWIYGQQGYIRVTLNLVKIKTPSLDMILSKSSIMARLCFAILSFFLSNFQLREFYNCTVQREIIYPARLVTSFNNYILEDGGKAEQVNKDLLLMNF